MQLFYLLSRLDDHFVELINVETAMQDSAIEENNAMKRYPARLHVLMAQQAPYAVVIRRGPAKAVATVGWNRENDSFALGQWLLGRIYERRSDLSPDGKNLIYFARKERRADPLMSSWTAISRAPYLKADGFWPRASCWNGGGLFLSNYEYWLNGGWDCSPFTADRVRTPAGLKYDANYPSDAYFGGECPGVYYLRLQRDGWIMVACDSHRRKLDGEWKFHRLNAETLPSRVGAVFEKRLPGGWILRKLAYATCSRPGRGCYFDEHELENAELDELLDCSTWEWADLDGDRLVWATGGSIYAGYLSSAGLSEQRRLFDFNDMRFEALAAPY
jgi:hypothetical protein